MRFFYWLSIYEKLYDDLATEKDDFLTLKVIEDDIRTDAYLARKKKLNQHEWKKYRLDEKKRKLKGRHPRKHKKGNMVPIEVDLRSE
jgi:hypothetical protein